MIPSGQAGCHNAKHVQKGSDEQSRRGPLRSKYAPTKGPWARSCQQGCGGNERSEDATHRARPEEDQRGRCPRDNSHIILILVEFGLVVLLGHTDSCLTDCQQAMTFGDTKGNKFRTIQPAKAVEAGAPASENNEPRNDAAIGAILPPATGRVTFSMFPEGPPSVDLFSRS